MQRIILCTTLHPRDHHFTGKHGNGVAVFKQAAGSLFARFVTTLPLNEAIRAVNLLNRESRDAYEAAHGFADRVLPQVQANPLLVRS